MRHKGRQGALATLSLGDKIPRSKRELLALTRRADLELSGAVLGGRLRGSGTLAGEANHGTVVLDEELHYSLSLRFVSVRSAVYDPDAGTIRVSVTLPVLGARDILLLEEV